MAGRPPPGRDIADQHGREPEPIQVPNVILGKEGWPHIPLFREKTEEKELDKGDNSARDALHFCTAYLMLKPARGDEGNVTESGPQGDVSCWVLGHDWMSWGG